MPLFETAKEKAEREEQAKMELKIKMNMNLRTLNSRLSQLDNEIDSFLNEAERFKLAGNRDRSMNNYSKYLHRRKLRAFVSKYADMVTQAAILVETGSLTNDVLAVLGQLMNSETMNPAAIQKILVQAGVLTSKMEGMEAYFSQMNGTAEEDAAAAAWFDSGKTPAGIEASPAANNTDEISEIEAELKKSTVK